MWEIIFFSRTTVDVISFFLNLAAAEQNFTLPEENLEHIFIRYWHLEMAEDRCDLVSALHVVECVLDSMDLLRSDPYAPN